jgi:hypothetical protein
MSLKSGVAVEVRYALDNLMIYSSEFALKLSDHPEMLDTLIDFMEVTRNYLFPSKNSKFYTYKELYEMEDFSQNSLQSGCLKTFNGFLEANEKFLAGGMILRNSCLVPDNFGLLTKNIRFHYLMFDLLDVPIPKELEDFYSSRKEQLISYPSVCALEQRKNAIISLSTIASHVRLPDQQTTDTIMKVLADFIQEQDLYYVYPSVEILSKLLLTPTNHQYIVETSTDLAQVVLSLLDILPGKGFTYETTPNQMALWELVMLILSVLTTIVKGDLIQKFVSIPGFKSIMLTLSKRPVSSPKYRPPQELLQQFSGVRERAFEIYLILARMGKRDQELLLTKMLFAHRDGDAWLVKMIVDFLSDDGDV